MALLMVVAMSQCKKNEQNASDNQGEAVTITLDVKNGNDSKVIVNPTTGTVDFENGDQIIVASGGKYVGTLTYNGNLFTGAISNATEGYPLQFYFLGNVTPAETLTSGVTESCSVVISDQTQHLPVISAAPSYENYTASMTNYTANLLNKCALVKFNVSTTSEAAICVTGFNNKVTVNFMDNTLTNSQEGNGVITLPSGNGEKWAILLPQEALEAGEQGSDYSQDGVYTGTRGAVPAITANGYLTLGIQVMVTNSGEVPVGAINGLFTINANGNQVYFSRGNLQYIGSASSPYWKFADNQWDYFGDNGQGSEDQDVDRDLFGWGTSGYNHGANCYQPWNTSQTDSDYYAYGGYTYNLYDQTGKADWGYNPISNGGNIANQWRTLTQPEWNYVFNTRNTISGIRYAKANVNNVNGVILLPDDWSSSIYSLNNINTNCTGDFSSNTISSSQWTTLENAGAVFLPAAGFRFAGTSVGNVGSRGYYCSASYCNGVYAYYVLFGDSSFDTNGNNRYKGQSVRLVCDIE
jgi:hypothetical protein